MLTRRFSLLALFAFACGKALGAEIYAAPHGSCDGFPRLAIGMAADMCAGLVIGPTQADANRQVRLPRELLELDGGDWLLTDLGAWNESSGALWRIHVNADHSTSLKPVIRNLHLPHSLSSGPDRLVYASEMGRIFRFDPRAADPAATIETVVSGLPGNTLHANRHPLASFIFDADGALLINVGAPSDQCLTALGRPGAPVCLESEADEHAASIRRYPLVGAGKWSTQYTIYAQGLRNSVALARHSSGTLLQAENSYDFDARFQPFEEINVIQAGRHYGWPYCYNNQSPSPGWREQPVARCSSVRFTPPTLLLPPHSAPLSMLWYQGPMFPRLQGRLLVTLHGFRSVGGRIIALQTDAKGLPVRTRHARFPIYGGNSVAYSFANSAEAFVLTPRWDKVPGLRPQGSPVGLVVARDGAIWTTDDRAGMVIRIAREGKISTGATAR